jgi:hypothetical protein
MNLEQQLADIRAKCIEANPEKDWTRITVDEPCRLADVLLAMDSNNVAVKDTGAILVRDPETYNFGWEKPHPVWNLRTDDLTQQSPETIAFIHSLLCA